MKNAKIFVKADLILYALKQKFTQTLNYKKYITASLWPWVHCKHKKQNKL